MPEPEALPHEEVLYVLEHERAPLTAEQLHQQLHASDMEIDLRGVKLTLRALAGDGRVQEHPDGRWSLRRPPRPSGERRLQSALPSRSPAPPPSAASATGVERRIHRDTISSATPSEEAWRRASAPSPPAGPTPPPPSPRPATTQDEIWATFRQTLRAGLQPLPPGASVDLVVAAHEWSLVTPLSINSKADLQSLPVIQVDPYEHQVRSIVAFFRRLSPRGLIADDVGLGKTVTAGLILAELIKRRKAQSFLVIAPKLILEQWREELREKFNLAAEVCVGGELRRALRPGARVITTYHSASLHHDAVKAAEIHVAILDEIHKLRNLHAPNPPAMARHLHQLQREGAFRWVIGLSATPLQNRLHDLYGIADILRAPNPNPYGSLQHFVQTYLEDGAQGRRLRPQARDEFRRRTSEYMHRTSRRESRIEFPRREVHIEAVQASEPEQAALARALQVLVSSRSNPLERISLAQSILSSPSAAIEALRHQIERGRAEFQAVLPAFQALRSTAKIDRLRALVRGLRERDPQGWRVLVFTLRKATAEAIRTALAADGLTEQLVEIRGDRAQDNQRAIEAFTASPPRARVLVSTDAGAEGVNLQVCNVLVNMDLPWNPMLLEQRVGRIQRLGQRAQSVVLYNLVTKGTVEEQVVSRLYEKLALYDAAIGMAEEILGQLSGDGDDEDFALRILHMVEAAVQQRDVQTLQEELAENARRAKAQLEAATKEMDRLIGALDGPGPVAMPELTRIRPSMDVRTFWQAAMRASGWELSFRDNGATIEAFKRGHAVRRFTFDPGHRFRQVQVIGAHAVELVAEDERPLDEMVRVWTLRGLNATTLRKAPPLDDAASRVEAALGPRVRRVIRWERRGRPPGGNVEVVARVNTSVYHDQYEKILHLTAPVELDPAGKGVDTPLGAQLDRPLVAALSKAIAEDKDIQGFVGFYLGRRDAEVAQVERALRESGRDAPEARQRLLKEIRDRLTPMHEPTLIAVSGELVERAELHLEVELDTGRRLVIAVALSADRPVEKVLEARVAQTGGGAPTVCDAGHLCGSGGLLLCAEVGCGLQSCPRCQGWSACSACQRSLCAQHTRRCTGCGTPLCGAHAVSLSAGGLACAACSATCAASGQVVLARDLVRCEDTGERVLPEHSVLSAVSGRRIRLTNALWSEVSGGVAHKDEMARCAATGRRALPSELSTCEKSGARALPSELERCSFSRKRVLKRLLAPCEACGELALPEHLYPSHVSGKKVLARHLASCAVTGKLALREELAPSEVSGRLALPGELVMCEVTGKRALPDEIGNCAISGQRVLRSLLVPAARSSRQALRAHTGECAVCGKVALSDELGPCAATGRRAEPGCMARSELSGKLAIPGALARCALTGRRVLPAETTRCAATQRVVAIDQIVTCGYSGERVARDLVQTSAVTGVVGWTAHMERSQVSGAWAGRAELVQTSVGRLVLPSEARLCPCCGKPALLEKPYDEELCLCTSCKMPVCVADVGDGDRCDLCVQVLTELQPAVEPAAFVAAFPKARRWNVAVGYARQVGLGLPAWFAVLTAARLVVLDQGGHEVRARDVGRGEIDARVRAGE